MTFAVPPIVMFLNKHPMAAKADLSSLKRVVSGAAPLGAEMVEEFHQRHPYCAVGQGKDHSCRSEVEHPKYLHLDSAKVSVLRYTTLRFYCGPRNTVSSSVRRTKRTK
jgi:acyl-CoA synthetase (AMP-forming)/AMP-acid ligase II